MTEMKAGNGNRGRLGRLADRINQTLCGMHGHDPLLQFEGGRMFLKCVSCLHESNGWQCATSEAAKPDRSQAVKGAWLA